jgi:hypothetical protein
MNRELSRSGVCADDIERPIAFQWEEAAAARALAAGADRDVADYRAELRGHTRVLSALRETQLEHYGEHKADAAEIKAGLTHIVRLLEGMGGATEPDGPATGV